MVVLVSTTRVNFSRLNRVSTGILRHGAIGSSRLMSLLSDADVSPIHRDGIHSIQFQVAGKQMSFETGKIGRQADGAVVARLGDTVVYSTACYERETGFSDFPPLRVDYFARYSSIGKTIGSLSKRDSRGEDHEILIARLIDRPIRPIVDAGWRHDTQLLSWVLSYDKINAPEPLAICAASAALAISSIPISKPIAGVSVGYIDNVFVVNPSKMQLKGSPLTLTIAGTQEGILMVEGASKFLTNEQMIEAISVGHEAIKSICQEIDNFAKMVNKPKKRDTLRSMPPTLVKEINDVFGDAMLNALSIKEKQSRGEAMAAVEERIKRHFVRNPAKFFTSQRIPKFKQEQIQIVEEKSVEETPDADDIDVQPIEVSVDPLKTPAAVFDITPPKPPIALGNGFRGFSPRGYDAVDVRIATKKFISHKMHEMIDTTGKRTDGRRVDEVRPIAMETSWLPGAHGSALFTRGETQAITTATIGGENMGFISETLDGSDRRRFYLQYRFPPNANGEVGHVGGGLSRREIGHGHLAERALLPVIPEDAVFPQTIRGESLITESSGSSSMATVCGVCLAMLDAGIPLNRSVAGIAMGLFLPHCFNTNTKSTGITVNQRQPVILTDIIGLEDVLGTMDFKVAGDESGITAFQLDVKHDVGLSLSILQKALLQAQQGRVHILQKMNAHLAKPRPLHGKFASNVTMKIPQEKIGKLIGPKGRTLQGIVESLELEDIYVAEDGTVKIIGSNERLQEAMRAIYHVVDGHSDIILEVGKIYRGCKIVNVQAFGVFIEVAPGQEGLVHISELELRLNNIDPHREYVVGQTLDVKYLGLTDKGMKRFSRRAALLADNGI